MRYLKYILKFHIILSAAFCFAGGSTTYKVGQHIPLISIFDQTASENPLQQSIANTQTLDIALQAEDAAILVSRSVLYNFVYRKEHWNDPDQPKNKSFYNTQFSQFKWELYSLSNAQYFTDDNMLYLIIPKNKKHLFEQTFNLENLNNIKSLPLLTNISYNNLLDELQPSGIQSKAYLKNKVSLMHQDLIRLFKTIPLSSRALAIHQKEAWEHPILDVYLGGHGRRKPDTKIAGLTESEMQKFLTFLNEKLRIGVLMISSCFVGGENIRNFRFKRDVNNDEIFYPLNFIIIARSVGDLFSYSPNYKISQYTHQQFFKTIFSLAQNLGNDPKNILNILLKELGRGSLTSDSLHGEPNIPQIILPGGIEIQSLTPDDTVMVLGKVKVRAAELENKPIYAYPRKVKDSPKFDHWLNVLIYPKIINTPLILRSSHISPSFSLRQLIGKAWQNLPTFAEIITMNKTIFYKEKQKALFSELLDLKTLEEDHYLYPNIISMIHGNAAHYFKKIIFEGNALNSSGGIFMGIRDSFCNVSDRPTKKTFFIDNIEGSNDIAPILKAIRAIKGNLLKHPLENELKDASKNISLQNVIITTQGKQALDEDHFELSLKFQIHNTAWKFDFESHHWKDPLLKTIYNPVLSDFKKINVHEYAKEYQNLKDKIFDKEVTKLSKQKTVVDILKEKLEKTRKDQTLLYAQSLYELSSTLDQLAQINKLSQDKF